MALDCRDNIWLAWVAAFAAMTNRELESTSLPIETFYQNWRSAMSVKMRLSRGGSKKRPYYYVVIANSTSPRDGKYIEQIGTFNPLLKKDNPERSKLNEDRVKHWLSVGAQPTDRVMRLLDAAGLATRVASNNPERAKPKKKAQDRAAAAEAAKAKAAAAAAEKPAA
jgi:small subunit ribosomal protein S16